MTIFGILQVVCFLVLLTALTKPVGIYLTRVYSGDAGLAERIFGPLERLIYRLCRLRPDDEMSAFEYRRSLLKFSAVSTLAVYAIQRLQPHFPLNPESKSAVSPDSSFNTAISFVTNTNWQGYSGEVTMSYFTQMSALTVQNFVSAAVGLAVAVVLIRGISRVETRGLGNFWRDMVRGILFILLPLSFLTAVFFVSQGVVQNFKTYDTVETIEGSTQTIAQGPVASQLAIKMIGTNGGGFFNANSAHPFENPTPLTNFVQILMILVIPAGLTYMLGSMTNARRHGWVIYFSMLVMLIVGIALANWAETQGNPSFPAGVDQMTGGGNLEGKEVRFGLSGSILFAVVTTGASCGAVNSMHDSFTALGGAVPLLNILLGEVIFGGVGAGMYGMLVFVILTVFIAGLLVGRSPEYLGKRIDAYEIQMVMLYALLFPLIILVPAASTIVNSSALQSLGNTGPHGLTEVVYAFSSAAGNNGSAFAGLNSNTPWFNTMLAVSIFAGRYLMIIPVLAIASGLAAKKRIPESLGTFPVNTISFAVLLIGVIVILGALTFLPVLTLGPLLEHASN